MSLLNFMEIGETLTLEFHIVKSLPFPISDDKWVFQYLLQLEFSQDGVIIADSNNTVFWKTKKRLFFSDLPFLITQQPKAVS